MDILKTSVRLCLIGAVLLFSQGVMAQFQKTFGTPDNDILWSLVPNQTGDQWVMTGYNRVATNNATDNAYVVSVNSSGNMAWSNEYINPAGDMNWACDAAFAQNGELYISGRNVGTSGDDMLLMHLNPITGSVLDQVHLDGFGEYGRNVTMDASDRLITTGYSGNNIVVARTGTGGGGALGTTFSRIYDNAGSIEYGNDIIPNNTGNGYIVTGSRFYMGSSSRSALVMNVHTSGAIIWQIEYDLGPNSDESFSSVRALNTSNGYVLSGNTNGAGAGLLDALMVVINNNGVVQLETTFGGVASDIASCAIQTTDGGFALMGHSMSFGAGSSDLYLIKTDAIGVLDWSMVYGGVSADYCSANYNPLYQLPNGGFSFAGNTNSFGAGGTDFYLIQTDDRGISGCNETEAETIQMYPNSSVVSASLSKLVTTLTDVPCTLNHCLSDQALATDEDVLCCVEDWHKTSANNANHDEGNDITTDIDGNVYVVGTYDEFTEFDGENVPVSGTSSSEAMFLAKYSPCGELEWVSYSKGTNAVDETTGKGVILDESKGLAFVTGAYNGTDNRFFDAGGGAINAISVGSIGQIGMYVACINMADGLVNWVKDYDDSQMDFKPTAVAVQPGDEEVFVCGTVYSPNDTRVFLFKMSSANPTLVPFVDFASDNSYATDIVATPGSQRLYITGRYEVEMVMGAPASLCNIVQIDPLDVPWVSSDAFLLFIDDATLPTYSLTKGGSRGSGWSEASGVIVDPFGQVCVVGSYTGKMDNSFTYPIPATVLGTIATGSPSDMFVARVSPTGAWLASTWIVSTSGSGISNTLGRDVHYDGTEYIALGEFDQDITLLPSTSLSHTNAGTPHMFLGRFEIVAGDAQWGLEPQEDEQNPTRVVVDDVGAIYSTGWYEGQMDMQFGNVPTLVNTSSGTGGNCFIVRANVSIGDFFFVDPDFDPTGLDENNESVFEVFPNPSQGILTVNYQGAETGLGVITVYNELQQVVEKVQWLEGDTQASIDLSDAASGMYFIKMEVGSKTEVTKVMVSK